MSSLKLYLSVFLFLFVTDAFSQGDKQYKGDFYLTGDTIVGYAEYDYELQNGDTVKQGNFLFQSTLDGNKGEYFKGIEFEGRFSNNKKNGNWLFRASRLKPTGSPKIINGYITYPSSGSRYSINAIFKNGIANGSWEVLSCKLDSNICTDTVFWVQTHFKSGDLQGSLTGKTNQINLKGSFVNSGLISGEWITEHKVGGNRIEEVRLYEKGKLVKVFFIIDSERVDVELPGVNLNIGEEEENLDTIPISELYFQVILHSAKTANKSNLTALLDSTNRLVSNSLSSLEEYNHHRLWRLLPGSERTRYGKAVLKKFPFTDEEEDFAQVAAEKVKEISEVFKAFFNDNQIDISKHSFEDLSLQYETMKIYRANIESLDSIVRDYNAEFFQYLNREDFLKHFNPQITTGTNKVNYQFKDSEKSEEVNFVEIDANNDNYYTQRLEYLDRVAEKVNEIHSLADKRVEQFKKEAKLNEAEEKLISSRDTLYLLYNREEQPENFNDFHFSVTPKARSFIKNKFDEYASLTVEERLKASDSLISCFQNLVFLYDVLAEQPDKIQKIDDLYMRNIWSPFTYTYMDERVKERIFEAYDNIVYPQVMDYLKNNINCSKIKSSAENLNAIYSKMVKLRDRDTKQLERELRKANKLEEVNEIMNLNLTLD